MCICDEKFTVEVGIDRVLWIDLCKYRVDLRYTDLHSWKIVDRAGGGGGGGMFFFKKWGGEGGRCLDFSVKLEINAYTTANTEGLGTALR